MADLATLVEQEIPEARQNLESSYANLERVAAYCEANYLQSADKNAALEETKKYTVQSLASVAYQINTLASNLLQMLDFQADKLSDMENQVGNIAQIIDIHKEKVARREIGVLTTNKVVTRQHKIVAPAEQEKPMRYQRLRLNYESLDDIGHGVKLPSREPRVIVRRQGSTASAASSNSGSAGPDAYSRPPTLAQQVLTLQQQEYASHYASGGGGRLSQASGRAPGSREYRTPVTVPPPDAPVLQSAEYIQQRYPNMVQTSQAAAYQQGRSSLVGGQNYSAVNVQSVYGGSQYGAAPMQMPPPQQVVRPMLHSGSMMYRDAAEDFPPPPLEFTVSRDGSDSPPLPPPPMEDYPMRASAVPDWVPPNFVEKVVALYDYQADKPDELSFQENSIIYVLRKNEDGWYEGVLDGVTGLFPGNYVEPCL